MNVIFTILLIGFVFPEPPGILGALIHWHFFGGKTEQEEDYKKWERLNDIERELKKEGKTIHDEISLAKKGQSKYFKTNL